MTNLLVGFDSAWTATNSGALVGVLRSDAGTFHEFGEPEVANYEQARDLILRWQEEHAPAATIIFLDQPTIVKNPKGQRPVESIVSASVSRRRGGMQPSSTSRKGMFDAEAPVWPFLTLFGGVADPLEPIYGTRVFETYPVLTIISLGWTLPDNDRPLGRLPKYNPQVKKTFATSDWRHVGESVSEEFRLRGISELTQWASRAAQLPSPRKQDQDRLDACLCLLGALHLIERKECLMVGDQQTGYIVVPHNPRLQTELDERCREIGQAPHEWVRAFRLNPGPAMNP